MQKHIITFIDKGSPAYKAHIHTGDVLLSINNEPVIDMIDYTYLTTQEDLYVELLGKNEKKKIIHINKELYEPLGLGFSTTLMSDIKTCSNQCMFCFVDQMPKDMRSSLYVKDDDWRMSFIMGNYITLTNTSDQEFSRILKRKVSPLYISVHSTNPELRTRIMGNKTAGKILQRLIQLKNNQISFHTQIVLCRGINDGKNLINTLNDLKSLYPMCKTCAVVPVGVTKFRDNLQNIQTYDSASSKEVINTVEQFQELCLKEFGTRFVFLSDEWYLNAGVELPEYYEYEDFEQIENGVGLLRLSEHEFNLNLDGRIPLKQRVMYSIAGGYGCRHFFQKLYSKLSEYNIETKLYPIKNTYFGGNVNVAGLVTGSDLVSQLKGRIDTDILLIPKNMLRENDNVFLDNVSIRDVEEALNVRIVAFSDNNIIDYLFGDIV